MVTGKDQSFCFFLFFFLYKEISREMKENDSSSLPGWIIIVVENFVLVGQGRFLIDYDSIGDDEMEIIII